MGYIVEVRERGKSNRQLVVDDRVEVGRSASGLRVDDPVASRRHLLLTPMPTGLLVTDLGSSNGTTVNGVVIEEEAVAVAGDVIGLGEVTLVVLSEDRPGRLEGVPSQGEPGSGTDAWRGAEISGPRGPAGGRLTEDLSVRETEAAIFRFRPGTAGERALSRFVPAVARARRRLSGLGSEPWGVRPVICLVDPFPDPERPERMVARGTWVNAAGGEIWMVVTAESPPESPERPLALFFGAALPAATDLDALLEGYGLAVADVESPEEELSTRKLPPLVTATGELRSIMALSFVRYLLGKEGREFFLQMLSTAVPGRVDAAVTEVYGMGLAGLEEGWRHKLDTAALPGPVTFIRLSARYLRANLRREIELAIILFVQLSFGIVFPFAFRRLLDEAIPKRDTSMLVEIIVVLAVLFGVSMLAGLRAAYLSSYISGSIVRRLRGEMFAQLQRLSPGWFARRQQGDLLSRLMEDVNVFEMGVTQVLRDGAFQLLSLATAAGVLVALSVPLGLPVLAGAAGVGLVYRLMGRQVRRRSVAVQECGGSLLSVAAENLAAYPVVRAFGLESRERARFRQASDRLFARELRLYLFGGLFSLSVNAVATVMRLAVLAVGGWLVIKGNLAAGTFVVVMSQIGQVVSPVSALSGVGQQLQVASGALVRLNEIMQAVPEVTDSVHATELAPLTGEIRFAQVAFSYSADKSTLDGIDVTLPAGSRVAFVGPTGAGKSTLLQLLLRFDDPDSGAVLFDGTDIRSVSLASLRGQLGVVFQDTFLFDTSVRENIGLGSVGASVEDIEAAARLAGVHDYVMSLPRGYDTRVGERGVRLSGGQRQRLAIARAVLRRPQVLLLDEATSALDARTERSVMAAVTRAGEGRTTIAVTHRLSSVVDYDAIHVVVDGRIVESGRHEELLAGGGVYADLWAEQAGAGPAPARGGVEVLESLARMPLFRGLASDELARVASRLQEVRLAAGETVSEDGRLYMVVAGHGRVLYWAESGASVPSAWLGPGDAFGLAALLGDDTGGVLEAAGDVDLLALDAKDLAHLTLALPALARALSDAHDSAGPGEGIRLSRLVLRPWPVVPEAARRAGHSASRQLVTR